MYPGYDQIVSEAARLRYRSAGEFTAPMVVRMPCGGGIFGGQTHSQSPEALFTHVCGLKTVIPSNPYDAKGLLIAAIEDDDPVIFLEPKRVYNGPFNGHHDQPVVPWARHPLGETPDGHYTVPLGQAAVRREGAAVTVLAYGTMVHVAEAAAAETGVDAEIIDLRTLVPLDIEAIERSVRKTGRCVILHEATRTSGFGAELSAQVQERCFYHLEAPILRVTGWDTPYPHAQEWDYFPGPTASARPSAPCWRPEMGDARRQAAGYRRGRRRGRAGRLARQGRRRGAGGTAARRGDDRQGDGGDPLAGRRHHPGAGRRGGQYAGGGRRTRADRGVGPGGRGRRRRARRASPR